MNADDLDADDLDDDDLDDDLEQDRRTATIAAEVCRQMLEATFNRVLAELAKQGWGPRPDKDFSAEIALAEMKAKVFLDEHYRRKEGKQ
jgi:hypothetical protein